MLINNQRFNFTTCEINKAGVNQEIEVVDTRGEYLFLYRLEVDQLQLGVEAASIIEAAKSLNT